MTATQIPPLQAQCHHNQQLFSDYNLTAILPTRPEWQQLAADACASLAEVQRRFAANTSAQSKAHPVKSAVGSQGAPGQRGREQEH